MSVRGGGGGIDKILAREMEGEKARRRVRARLARRRQELETDTPKAAVRKQL